MHETVESGKLHSGKTESSLCTKVRGGDLRDCNASTLMYSEVYLSVEMTGACSLEMGLILELSPELLDSDGFSLSVFKMLLDEILRA